jgi:hypothetical protein
MDESKTFQRDEPPPLTGACARAVLAAVIARLSDQDAVALCELMLSWYPEQQSNSTKGKG